MGKQPLLREQEEPGRAHPKWKWKPLEFMLGSSGTPKSPATRLNGPRVAEHFIIYSHNYLI